MVLSQIGTAYGLQQTMRTVHGDSPGTPPTQRHFTGAVKEGVSGELQCIVQRGGD